VPANFVDPPAWHASLAGVIVAAGGLIRDPGGRVLCVKPNYRDYWTLPGGICEAGEPPHAGCAREVAEEVGLGLPVGPLLTVDWHQALPQYGLDARPTLYFIFDDGVVPADVRIVLQRDELDDYQFADPGALAGLLAPTGLRRTLAAIVAADSGRTRYLPHEPD
jgi:8-oxo-dGTP diphosphatase